MKDIHVLSFLKIVEDFWFMNFLSISKFLFIIFFRKVSFAFIMILHLAVHHYCVFVWGGLGGLGMRLLWCDIKAFLHDLCHHQLAVNDLIHLACVYLTPTIFKYPPQKKLSVLKILTSLQPNSKGRHHLPSVVAKH